AAPEPPESRGARTVPPAPAAPSAEFGAPPPAAPLALLLRRHDRRSHRHVRAAGCESHQDQEDEARGHCSSHRRLHRRNARTSGRGSGPRPKAQSPRAMNGYRKSVGGTKGSLMARGLTQRSRFSTLPALSFVPEARAPPKGCWPTTAPVGLSFT